MGSNGDDHLLKHQEDEGVSGREVNEGFGQTGDVTDVGKSVVLDKEKPEQLDQGSLKEVQNQKKKSELESSYSKELKVSSSPRRG